MEQQDLGLNLNKRRTRKAVFLDEMNLVIPWSELLALIAPHAPAGKTGRPTAANAHDITQAVALLHGQEEVVFADLGYRGVHKREEVQAQHPNVDWQIAMMLGQRKCMDESKPVNALKKQLERVKANIRAKVEYPFRVIKCQFGHRKVRYRGPVKTSQLLVMFAMSNLWMVRKRIVQGLQA